MKNYILKTGDDKDEKKSLKAAFGKMLGLMAEEKKELSLALIAIFINSGLSLVAPLLVGYTIDHYVIPKQFHGLLVFSGILFAIYVGAFIANYVQVRMMGAVGQRVLFKLRNAVFTKLQELPVAFFNQNKAGDLISRINNDTDKLNQFFSQTLMQFTGNAFIIIGAAIFILSINFRLGIAALVPAIGLFILTQLISGWVKTSNLRSLQAEGAMSGEIQESLGNFKVILAFNRRDYFREKFEVANKKNFKTSVIAGLANNLFGPVYDFAGNIGQLIVLAYGIYLIIHGSLAVGLLVSFLLYIGRFYDPLRQFASLWSSLQLALAGWDRISEILSLESDLPVIEDGHIVAPGSLMKFENVFFRYPNGKEVLRNINFNLEKGKTYALVGPTGGGKTTTASLIARLYDPSEGRVFLNGRDIRSYTADERSLKIGFILQEPFLFSGTVKDNLVYGNPAYEKMTSKELLDILKEDGLVSLLGRFEQGIDTPLSGAGDTLSLGERQLIAFMRAVLRRPELLILDEATANIDTVTEQLLEEILQKLPKETTKVIIAHRLNTIENADEIFFVNSGEIIEAGSMEHAVEMLLHGKRES
jgi:ATP-binding cassette subfamily B protein